MCRGRILLKLKKLEDAMRYWTLFVEPMEVEYELNMEMDKLEVMAKNFSLLEVEEHRSMKSWQTKLGVETDNMDVARVFEFVEEEDVHKKLEL
jgi:hypothetical protein